MHMVMLMLLKMNLESKVWGLLSRQAHPLREIGSFGIRDSGRGPYLALGDFDPTIGDALPWCTAANMGEAPPCCAKRGVTPKGVLPPDAETGAAEGVVLPGHLSLGTVLLARISSNCSDPLLDLVP
jgi:hypothetical protein